MAKPAYSDEEIQDLLQALYQEKKRNKDREEQLAVLRQELSQVRENPPSTDASPYKKEIEQLKHLFQVYKQKYEKALESQQRIPEQQTEQQALSEQVSKLKNLLNEQLEENKRIKQGAEKLASILLEKEKKIAELQQFEYSYRKTSQQKHQWEATKEQHQTFVDSLRVEKEQILKELEESQQHSRQLERVIHYLRERQEEAQLEATQLEEEFQNTRQTIVSLNEDLQAAKLQVSEMEGRYQEETMAKQEALNEISALQEQFESLKNTIVQSRQKQNLQEQANAQIENQIHELRKELEQLNTLLEQKNGYIEELEKERESAKESIARSLFETKELEARYLDCISEKNELQTNLYGLNQQLQQQQEVIEAAKQQLQEMEADKKNLENNFEQFKASQEENNNRLKISQQHLAKKVKENSELAEKINLQEKQIQEQQNALNQSRLKVAEMQTALDGQIFQEKRLHEQLQEAVKASESLAAKWEEKYFRISEKWQDAELKIKELKKFEEKYNQLQGLLSNLGNVLGTSSVGVISQAAAATPASPPPDVSPPYIQEVKEPEKRQEWVEPIPPPEELPPSKPFQNLFDIPKPHARPKDNFFE